MKLNYMVNVIPQRNLTIIKHRKITRFTKMCLKYILSLFCCNSNNRVYSENLIGRICNNVSNVNVNQQGPVCTQVEPQYDAHDDTRSDTQSDTRIESQCESQCSTYHDAHSHTSKDISHEDNLQDCTICLAPMDTKESSRYTLKCGHSYHFGCYQKWAEKSNTCPICRNVSNENPEIVSIRNLLKTMVENKLIPEEEAFQQFNTMTSFFEGNISYAEMRLRCG